ncbi:MAG: T9SS type A sorting domain-containing protein [Bacteroidota bacterium]
MKNLNQKPQALLIALLFLIFSLQSGKTSAQCAENFITGEETQYSGYADSEYHQTYIVPCDGILSKYSLAVGINATCTACGYDLSVTLKCPDGSTKRFQSEQTLGTGGYLTKTVNTVLPVGINVKKGDIFTFVLERHGAVKYAYNSPSLYPDGTVNDAADRSMAFAVQIDEACTAPTVTRPISGSTTVSTGDPLTLTADGSSPKSFSYQWQSSTDNQTWTDVNGQNTATYTKPAKFADNGLKLRCKLYVPATDCISYTDPVTLTVNCVTPVITQQMPLSQTSSTASSTFSIVAPGEYTYNWERKYSISSTQWFTIVGNTQTTSLKSQSSLTDGYVLRCTVKQGTCSVTSRESIAYFCNPKSLATITANPEPVTAAEGTNASFSVTSTDATAYNWLSMTPQGVYALLPGSVSSNASTLSLPATADLNKSQLICAVKKGSCSTTSNGGLLTVSAAPACTNPTISTQPAVLTKLVPNQPATISVSATASPASHTLTYAWKSSINKIGTYRYIIGATEASYTRTTNQTSTFYFVCEIKDGNCLTTSDIATITVAEPECYAPEVTKDPTDITVITGNASAFTVQAVSNPTQRSLSFQWQEGISGVYSNIGGATASSYITPDATPEMNGRTYRCIVTDVSCTDTSAAGTLYVLNKPTIYTEAARGNSGTDVTILVKANKLTNYQMIQGNLQFPYPVAAVKSVSATSALTSTPGISGTVVKQSNSVVTYSYDAQGNNFTIADGSTIFEIVVTLASNNDYYDACAAPYSLNTPTPVKAGRLVNGFPQVVTPEMSYQDICLNAKPSTITVGTIGRACPGVAGLEIPFTAAGIFGDEPNFVLYEGSNPVPATLENNTFILTGSLSVGGHVFTIKETTQNVSGDAFGVIVNPFDQPSVVVNNNTVTNGNTSTSCPGSNFSVAITATNAISWNSSLYDNGSSQTSKTFTLVNPSGILAATALNVYSQNQDGCINPTAYTVKVEAKDDQAPSVTTNLLMSATIPAGQTTVNYNLTGYFSSASDNCTASGNLVKTYLTSGGSLINDPTAYPLTEGTNSFILKVTDASNNAIQLNFSVTAYSTPQFALTANGQTSNGVGTPTLTYTVKGNGSSSVRNYTSISGTIDFKRFAKSGSISLIPSGSNFTSSFSNGVFTYAAENVDVAENADLFTISLTPNVAYADTDEVYQPSITATWTTTRGSTAAITSALGSNTLSGLAVINGSLQKDGSAFCGNTQITCQGCITTNGFTNTVTVAKNGDDCPNSYSFRAVPGTKISLKAADLDNTEVTTITTLHVLANRQFILGTETLDANSQGAADVDNTGDVNTLDVLQQRQVVLGTKSKFTNIFGDASAFNYLVDGGKINGYEVEKGTHTFNLAVYEIGKTFIQNPSLEDLKGEDLVVELGSATTAKGKIVQVPVIAKGNNSLAGYQGTIEWNSEMLAFNKLISVKNEIMTGGHLLADGKLTISYVEGLGRNTAFTPGDTLFMIEYTVLDAANYQTEVSINSSATPAKAYTAKGVASDIVANRGTVYVSNATGIAEQNGRNSVFNAVPNPFTTGTSISFELQNDQDLDFTVFSTLGTMVTQSNFYKAGMHTWTLPAGDLAKGIYYINIKGSAINETIKVIKQ